jgi:uncharacterized Zn finger protein
MSAREPMLDKARRLLAEDRVQVIFATEDRVTARVRGDSGIHDVAWDLGTWDCTCAAYGTCSHRLAVKLCTMQSVARVSAGAP